MSGSYALSGVLEDFCLAMTTESLVSVQHFPVGKALSGFGTAATAAACLDAGIHTMLLVAVAFCWLKIAFAWVYLFV